MKSADTLSRAAGSQGRMKVKKHRRKYYLNYCSPSDMKIQKDAVHFECLTIRVNHALLPARVTGSPQITEGAIQMKYIPSFTY